MTMNYRLLILPVLLSVFLSCSKEAEKQKEAPRTQVEIVTSEGTILLELYNETPQHRDNFVKIINDGILDSVLFHRVIENFMIQGGDPDSKYANADDTLGSGGLDYRVPAEFHPDLFHKKGVLAAARDGNSERASSSTQFYIVQGRVFTDSLLDVQLERVNGWLAQHYVKHDPAHALLFDSLNMAYEAEDWENFSRINTQFREMAENYDGFQPYAYPETHKTVYKTIGGTPHLDQNYTVFGEVVSGLEVVDSIAASPTNDLDRPIEDVRILSIEVLEPTN